jgi:hypothetical protein
MLFLPLMSAVRHSIRASRHADGAAGPSARGQTTACSHQVVALRLKRHSTSCSFLQGCALAATAELVLVAADAPGMVQSQPALPQQWHLAKQEVVSATCHLHTPVDGVWVRNVPFRIEVAPVQIQSGCRSTTNSTIRSKAAVDQPLSTSISMIKSKVAVDQPLSTSAMIRLPRCSGSDWGESNARYE